MEPRNDEEIDREIMERDPQEPIAADPAEEAEVELEDEEDDEDDADEDDDD